MIKNAFKRRITIAFLSLIIISIIYLFPNDKSNNDFSTIRIYKDELKSVIFLIDPNDYVAMTSIYLNETNSIDKVRAILESLTINSSKKDLITNGFKQIIPEKTKIISLNLKDGLLKIDFSKEILDTDNEEKMVEAIVFSLTSIDEIKEVLIYVNGNHLNKINNIYYPNPLNRNFGINKNYDLDNYKDITKTTIYYLSKYDNYYYYVPVTKIENNPLPKIEIIIDELKSKPTTNTNLMSYLASNAELINYEILEEKINISFNNYILANLSDKEIIEEVKYAIALSIKDNFNAEIINFMVYDELIEKVEIKSLNNI